MKILITGAGGNLGGLLARHLLGVDDVSLRLMVHRREIGPELVVPGKTEIVRADLAYPATLDAAVQGVDQIVHFAGVLFKARPEKFLPTTNTVWFRNLIDAANRHGIRKIILISFPHVEGPTSFDAPATGRLDREPISAHARTRLEEEKLLFAHIAQPVSLRVGMVYGRGILMVDAARWFARHRLLGVWREPTEIHLISREDFCSATTAAIIKPDANGIYHLGDEGRDTLQTFLDQACDQWGLRRPWRMPLGLINSAACLFELYSGLTGAASPLTRDFIKIGRVPYHGDTRRMRAELLPRLRYPTLKEGISTL